MADDEPVPAKWEKKLNQIEYERLKTFEYSGRLNEVLIEAFDFWTDLGLIAVLYVFSQENPDVQYTDPVIGVLTATTYTSCDTGLPEDTRNTGLFLQLFYAALIIQVLNVVVRMTVALLKLPYKKNVNSFYKAGVFTVGIIVTVIAPHNGLFFIDAVFERKTEDKDVVLLTQREIRLDMLLLGLEDFPQFVIQAVFFSNVVTGDVPIAFWLSTIVTIFSILVTMGSIGVKLYKLKALRRQVGLDKSKSDLTSDI